MKHYGLPQSLTGTEWVTITQTQNGHDALCSMPLSTLVAFLSGSIFASLPRTEPTTPGIPWNNNGVVSIS